MAIININTLPDSDLTYLTNQFDFYALANLGQRYGVSGDGVTTSSFEFGDLLDNNNLDENFIGFIKYNGTNVSIGAINSEHQHIKELEKIIKDTNNLIYSDEQITLDFIINSCDYYSNSIILYDETKNLYTIGLVGYSEVDGSTHDISIIIFDNDDNTIVEAIHINSNRFQADKYIDGTFYNTEPDGIKEIINIKHVYKNLENNYILDTYINYKNAELTDDYTYVNNYYEFSMGELSVDFIDIIKSLGTNFNITNFLSLSIITDNFMKLDVMSNIQLNYNVNNVYFSIPNLESTDIFTNDFINTIYYFNNDLTYILPFTKKYFSKHTYTLDNYKLKQQIIAAFTKKICEDSGVIPSIGNELYIYIPLNYVFNYYCKTSDPYYIYNSAINIPVSYVNLLNLKDIHMPTTRTSNYNRCITYDFGILYNSDLTDTIYGISFVKKYIMPYINGDGYWVVNDEETDVYAKGLHAGQPNIIITYTDALKNTKVISSARYKDLFINRDGEIWKQTYVQIEPINKLNVHDNDEEILSRNIIVKENVLSSDNINIDSKYNKLTTYTLNYSEYPDNIKELLKYSLIINITNVNTEVVLKKSTVTPLKDILGTDGVVTTLWTLNEETEQFECVMNPSNKNWALDLHYMESLSSLIDWHVTNADYLEPDNYYYDQVVFQSSYALLKNETEDDEEKLVYTYVYPNIRLIDSTKDDYFLNSFSTSNYHNELNLLVEFNTTINKNDREITNISQNETRYLNIDNGKINTGVSKYFDSCEYTPSYLTPTLEMKEVIVRNENNLNRINIITPDKNSNMYYTYIGSSYELEDKSLVHIGSSNKNFSFGTNTLAYQNDNFIKQNQIAVDFNVTYINGEMYVDNNVYTNGVNWQITYYKTKNNTTLKCNNLIYTPISEEYEFKIKEDKQNGDDYDINTIKNSDEDIEIAINKKRSIFSNNNHFNITLLNNKLFNNFLNFKLFNTIKVTNNVNVYFLSVRNLISILNIPNNVLPHVISNSEIYNIENTDTNPNILVDKLIRITNIEKLYNGICIGNPISITYFKDVNNEYVINIRELYTANTKIEFPYVLSLEK